MVRVHAELAEHRLELVVEAFLRLVVAGRVLSVTLPVASTRDPVVGSGRSSVESQKSTAWRAMFSSVRVGASFVSSGFSPLYIGAEDLPTIWMLPIGYSKSSLP